jgi:hypothetical protein
MSTRASHDATELSSGKDTLEELALDQLPYLGLFLILRFDA